MEIVSSKTVTLDVSAGAIRLMSVIGNRVEKWASLPLEPGLIEDGLIVDPPALGAKVRRLMQSSRIYATRVVSSITGLCSVFRVDEVPESAEKRSMEKMVLETAKQQMPVPAEQLYVSWQVVADGTQGGKLCVVGLVKDILDAEVKALNSVGINPYILKLKGMALMKLVDRNTDCLIVHMEPDSTNLVLMAADGLPLSMRSYAQKPEMDLEERMEALHRNLWQMQSYYEAHRSDPKDEGTTPLFLSGPIGENPDVAAELILSGNYEITPLAVPLEFPLNLPVAHYAVNLGLAVKGWQVPLNSSKPVEAKSDEVEVEQDG